MHLSHIALKALQPVMYRLSTFLVNVQHNDVILMQGTVGFIYQLYAPLENNINNFNVDG